MDKKNKLTETNDSLQNIGNCENPALGGGTKARRVFISYSHNDKEKVETIVKILEEEGYDVLFDRNIIPGSGFHNQIKNYIAHAHFFMPILTDDAGKRGWVHQEIGFALALRIPVIPLVVGCEPYTSAFLQEIQAIVVEDANENLLREKISNAFNKYAFFPTSFSKAGLYECAETTEERAVLLSSYAQDLNMINRSGMVRQSGGLSSFHIPNASLTNIVWKNRYGNRKQNDYHKKVLQIERMALDSHAMKSGCRLIIDLDLTYGYWGPPARKTRLETLLQFLYSMDDRTCQIAIKTKLKESITIIGNWFAAISIHPEIGRGYRQTIFTRHTPTVDQMIDQFDRTFQEVLSGFDLAKSRQHAIQEIKTRLEMLKDKERGKA